jgi:hypothetical protein
MKPEQIAEIEDWFVSTINLAGTIFNSRPAEENESDGHRLHRKRVTELCSALLSRFDDLLDLIATAKEVERLRADAARYLWLRDWAQSYQLHEWFEAGLSLEQIDGSIDEAIAKVSA